MRTGDLTKTQFVKITEELSHANAEFLNLSSQFSQDILNVIRTVIADKRAGQLRGLVVGKALQMFLRDIHAFVENIDVFTELVVVDFVVIAVVRVFDQNEVQFLFLREQIELIQNARELTARNVAVLGLVEVLEVRFHEHSFILDFNSENI